MAPTKYDVYPEYREDGHRQMVMTSETPIEVGFLATIREDKDTLGWFARTDLYAPWVGPFATCEDVRDALIAHHKACVAWRERAEWDPVTGDPYTERPAFSLERAA
jgi:hypothetical protein